MANARKPTVVPDASLSQATRVFKNKPFAKRASKDGIADEDLCRAARDLDEGKGDHLGGNVWKKRLDSNRSRAIVAAKPGAFWLFMYLYAKSDKDNIDAAEERAFKKLAASYATVGVEGIEDLIRVGTVLEICNAPATHIRQQATTGQGAPSRGAEKTKTSK